MSTTNESFAIGASAPYLIDTDKDKFSHPTIAINANKQLVEIHTKDIYLYYMLGNVTGPKFVFNSDGTKFVKGDYASVALNGPCVITSYTAANSNLLSVGIGLADFDKNTINWQNLGTLKIDGDKEGITTSSVALNDNGLFVIVFETTGGHLYCVTGLVNLSTAGIIYLSDMFKYSSSGFNPNIAITGTNFIETHQSSGVDGIIYQLGTVAINGSGKNSQSAITFFEDAPEIDFKKNTDEYDSHHPLSKAELPAPALDSNGRLTIVYKISSDGCLYFMYGTIDFDNNIITMKRPKLYLENYYRDDSLQGKKPAITTNEDGVVVQVHSADTGILYGSVAKYKDRSNWMQDYGNYTLAQLSIPGAHDAAMYVLDPATLTIGTDKDNTITQIQDIGNQLKAGIRYFDLRPVFEPTVPPSDNVKIYSGHYAAALGPVNSIEGGDGDSMKDILKQVASFVQSQTSEVVILKFSHFLDRAGDYFDFFFGSDFENPADKQPLITDLISMIATYIPPDNLYVHTSSTRIAETKLTDIIATAVDGKQQNCSKVVVLFDVKQLKQENLSPNGEKFVNTYRDLAKANAESTDIATINVSDYDLVMYDKYSNTNNLKIMTSSTTDPGQLYRIQQTSPDSMNYHSGDLYLLSWTLTLSTTDAIDPLNYSIKQLSQFANGVLVDAIVDNTNVKGAIITNKTFPNIIYVDKADCFVTDICIWLNDQNLFGA